MNVKQLKQYLTKHGIEEGSLYTIGGLGAGEIDGIEEVDGKWYCYYSQRGSKTNYRLFESESDACKYIAIRAKKLARIHGVWREVIIEITPADASNETNRDLQPSSSSPWISYMGNIIKYVTRLLRHGRNTPGCIDFDRVNKMNFLSVCASQACLGAITPNMRMITISVAGRQIDMRFHMTEVSQEDRREIDDIVFGMGILCADFDIRAHVSIVTEAITPDRSDGFTAVIYKARVEEFCYNNEAPDKKDRLPAWLVDCFRAALLGEIYPAIRAIAVGYDGEGSVLLRYHLDREPTEFDRESIEIVAANFDAMCAGQFAITRLDVECIYTDAAPRDIDALTGFVYSRREHDD